jgi:hypothetical protein
MTGSALPGGFSRRNPRSGILQELRLFPGSLRILQIPRDGGGYASLRRTHHTACCHRPQRLGAHARRGWRRLGLRARRGWLPGARREEEAGEGGGPGAPPGGRHHTTTARTKKSKEVLFVDAEEEEMERDGRRRSPLPHRATVRPPAEGRRRTPLSPAGRRGCTSALAAMGRRANTGRPPWGGGPWTVGEKGERRAGRRARPQHRTRGRGPVVAPPPRILDLHTAGGIQRSSRTGNSRRRDGRPAWRRRRAPPPPSVHIASACHRTHHATGPTSSHRL